MTEKQVFILKNFALNFIVFAIGYGLSGVFLFDDFDMLGTLGASVIFAVLMTSFTYLQSKMKRG